MIHQPELTEFLRGFQVFEKRESRDAIYKTADFLMTHHWPQPARIADNCYYSDRPAEKYIGFIRLCKTAQAKLAPHLGQNTKPFTKLFDEYNYAKFTKHWV